MTFDQSKFNQLVKDYRDDEAQFEKCVIVRKDDLAIALLHLEGAINNADKLKHSIERSISQETVGAYHRLADRLEGKR